MLAAGFAVAAQTTDIAAIDKNFRPATIGDVAVNYYDALAGAPFEVTGFAWRKPGGELYRIPAELTSEQTSEGVIALAKHTSGGAVRFRTDSPYLAIRATLRAGSDMNHMPRSGSCGFDLFQSDAKGASHYNTTIQPSPEHLKGEVLERKANSFAKAGEMRDWVIYLPLYGGVQSLEAGIAPGAKLEAPTPHRIAKPILFYGSSITQGGCASRPANNYTTMLCRAVDAPQINLGFSGNAKGEIALAEAIAGLDLAAFVYDYDYNAPGAAHLAKTHEPFFLKIREKNPDLPIIMMSKCSGPDAKRRDIIKKTCQNAIDRGDRNVYFIDGSELFGEPGKDYCTVDGCHPNDLGFYQMYRRVLPVLRQALDKR